MTIAQNVDKLLKFFGPNGENWRPDASSCLITGQHACFGYSKLPLQKALKKKLGDYYFKGGVSGFNDESDWPRVRRLLNAIKYRKPFRP